MVTMNTVALDQQPERAMLRGAGLRVTRPRLAVLTAVRTHQHSDATTVLEAVRTEIPNVSHQTVYDCLHALTETGLVRSLQPAGSTALYELRRDDNHHHLVCRGCGELVDVPCRTGSAPCVDAPVDHGYVIDEAEIYYWGLCPACRERGGHDSSPPPSDADDD